MGQAIGCTALILVVVFVIVFLLSLVFGPVLLQFVLPICAAIVAGFIILAIFGKV
jgi:hypothetical protein